MVLVDTSVWIRFLANRNPFAAQLDRLLEDGEAAGHDLVYGELLIGDTGGRREFLNRYNGLHRFAGVPHTHVAEFVRARSLYGRGIGWIDAHLLASALGGDGHLWTADGPLASVAAELGVGYPPREKY